MNNEVLGSVAKNPKCCKLKCSWEAYLRRSVASVARSVASEKWYKASHINILRWSVASVAKYIKKGGILAL